MIVTIKIDTDKHRMWISSFPLNLADEICKISKMFKLDTIDNQAQLNLNQIERFAVAMCVRKEEDERWASDVADCILAAKGEKCSDGVDGWLLTGQRGTSSLTIVKVLGTHEQRITASSMRKDMDIPYDPADLLRCVLLLDVAPPDWRSRLGEVAAQCPKWASLVDRWAELEALLEKERAKGDMASETYALMQELRGT